MELYCVEWDGTMGRLPEEKWFVALPDAVECALEHSDTLHTLMQHDIGELTPKLLVDAINNIRAGHHPLLSDGPDAYEAVHAVWVRGVHPVSELHELAAED